MHLVTDEAKWYHWVFAEPARPLELGRVIAKADTGAIALDLEGLACVGANFGVLRLTEPSNIECDGRPVRAVVDEAGGTLLLTLPDPGPHMVTIQ